MMAISLLLVAPAIGKRHEAEWNNRTYEMIMPYDEVEAWLQEDEEQVWKQLKEAGLTTVSVEAETLDSLESPDVCCYSNGGMETGTCVSK